MERTDIDIDELKKHRKEFKEQTEEDDVSLQIRIEQSIEDCASLGPEPSRLRMMMEECVHQMQMERQQLAELSIEHLDQVDRKIRMLEEEREENLRKMKMAEEQPEMAESGR